MEINGSSSHVLRHPGHLPGFVSLLSSNTNPHFRHFAGSTTTV